jgi:hypothetical protein
MGGFWHPESTHFSVNSVGFGKCCAHYPMKCLDLGSVSQLIVSVLSDKDICMIHIVIHSGHTWASVGVLLLLKYSIIFMPLSMTLHVLSTSPPPGTEFH